MEQRLSHLFIFVPPEYPMRLLQRVLCGLAACVLLPLFSSPAATQWRSTTPPILNPAPGTPEASAVFGEGSLAFSESGFPATVDMSRASRGRYAWLGAALGAAAGAVLFYTTAYPCSGDVMFCETGFVAYGVGGAALGALGGYLIGNTLRSDSGGRWAVTEVEPASVYHYLRDEAKAGTPNTAARAPLQEAHCFGVALPDSVRPVQYAEEKRKRRSGTRTMIFFRCSEIDT